MKEIPLTQGKMALVDDEDYQHLSQYKWHTQKGGYTYYAVRYYKVNGKWKALLMHREIMNALSGMPIDHINGNGWDNRKSNLRTCTQSDNQHNQRVLSGRGTSKYKGVAWRKARQKWYAYIKNKGKNISLGHYDSEIEAAKAHDVKARELFGQFANTNFKQALKGINE